MEMRLPKLLFSQQTGLALHSLLPPTPTAVMGEQVRPTNAEGLLRTIPSRPRMSEAPELLADWTD